MPPEIIVYYFDAVGNGGRRPSRGEFSKSTAYYRAFFFFERLSVRVYLYTTRTSARTLTQLRLRTYRGLSIVVVVIVLVVVTVFLLLPGNADLMSVWGRGRPFVAADELIACRDESARSATAAVETSFAVDVRSHADRSVLSPILWPRFFRHSFVFFRHWNRFSTPSLRRPDRKCQKQILYKPRNADWASRKIVGSDDGKQ